MVSKDLLADALNTLKTHEMAGKPDCEVKPSKMVRETLKILQSKGYIGDFEYIDEGTTGHFRVKLMGRINQCGAIKPRFPAKKTEWNEWEQKFIPGVGFGLLIVSTPAGLMTNEEAKTAATGGRLIAFVY